MAGDGVLFVCFVGKYIRGKWRGYFGQVNYSDPFLQIWELDYNLDYYCYYFLGRLGETIIRILMVVKVDLTGMEDWRGESWR